jgi:hypothetical protein
MKLPAKIEIQVICNGENNLGNIIVRMIVRAGTKNPFLIYFPKTNKQGKTFITALDFIDQVNSQYEMGLMDYNGSIETASQVVGIDLRYQDIADKRYLSGYDRLKWASIDEMNSYYRSCRNDKFSTKPQLIEIRRDEIIQFEINKNAT